MAKLVKISISFVFILFFINLVFSQVKINEVELNPEGSDEGNEWIELYSNQSVNLLGWKIVNADNQEILLNQTILGYFVINLNSQWLDNENESVRLYNGEQLVDFTPVLKDSFNDNKTWSNCENHWNLLIATPGYANNCISITNTPSSTNLSYTSSRNITIPYKYPIGFRLDWDDADIRNGDEFNIEIKAFNLENKKYDIKVYIYDNSKTKPISQTNDPNEGWISSNIYMKEFFIGPGNETSDVKLRIRESYRNFSGEATIGVRIRETETSKYIDESEEKIDILETVIKKASSSSSSIGLDENQIKDIENIRLEEPITTSNVINLEEPKTQVIKTKNNVIYQSKNELIKLYSIYALVILCILFLILLVLKRVI